LQEETMNVTDYRTGRPWAALAGALLLIATVAAGPVVAHDPVIGVVPDAVELTLSPGESADVAKTVHTPEFPPVVDICLQVDETGSMGRDADGDPPGEIGEIKDKAEDIFNAVAASGADAAWCVLGFRDYAISPYGDPGDWVYRLHSDVSTSLADFQNGVNALTAGGGNDTPEATLEALHYEATPGHPAIDSNQDGDTTDPEDTPAGEQPSWRTDAQRVSVLVTDAPCHEGAGVEVGYPSDADLAITEQALQDAGIIIIGVTPGAAGFGCVDALATATGGSVQDLGDSGENIAQAILAGLSEVEVEVTPQATCDDPNVAVSWDSASQTVVSGEDAIFLETITAGAGAPQGDTVTCTVEFLIDGNLLDGFTQTITIHIRDVEAPVVSCTEGVNPHGDTTPPAGSTTLPGSKGGQNEDGFYLLTAVDNVDPNPMIFVVDTGSGTIFGPYPSGTTIKYVEAPGATPSDQTIGSSTGEAGAVFVLIKGTGDAAVFATDESGNVSARVACLVPPPPK
jgi:hypothetical protein